MDDSRDDDAPENPGEEDVVMVEAPTQTLEEILAEEEQEARRAAAGGGADLARAEQEIASLRDAQLRKLAEFENFRKRTDREKAEYFRFALADFVRDLLPVLDNFERALGSLPKDLPRGFVEGVSLIYKQLQDVLAFFFNETPTTEKAQFDPHLHEAVETEACRDVPHHQIIGEVQKGYRLGKRVLRPALVKVCVHPEEEAGGAPAGDGHDGDAS